MITISQTEVAAAGGLLATVADKSCQVFLDVVSNYIRPMPQDVVEAVNQYVVHTDPHLDEYFAELLFRSVMPREKWAANFKEHTLFSVDDDLNGRLTWVNAATFGLPIAISGGVTPAFYFDEHLAGQTKIVPSVSQIVADEMLTDIPPPLRVLLDEINPIDEGGGAHQQHLNNLIKTLHEVRFWLGRDAATGTNTDDFLTPEWKRAVVDTSIAAVLYCLHNGIDLVADPDAKRASMWASLDNYAKRSPHSTDPNFPFVLNRIRGVYGDQRQAFERAVIRGSDGTVRPQLLILSRICFACEQCFGPNVRDLVATHFWEMETQNQLNFRAVKSAVEPLANRTHGRLATSVGLFTKTTLPQIEVEIPATRPGQRAQRRSCPVWIMSVRPAANVFHPNKPIQNIINENNYGSGLVLLHNTVLNTNVLFKCHGIPDDLWRRLLARLIQHEGEVIEPGKGRPEDCGCWYVLRLKNGGVGSFALNGNKAHRYLPRSSLDAAGLCELVKRTFYSQDTNVEAELSELVRKTFG